MELLRWKRDRQTEIRESTETKNNESYSRKVESRHGCDDRRARSYWIVSCTHKRVCEEKKSICAFICCASGRIGGILDAQAASSSTQARLESSEKLRDRDLLMTQSKAQGQPVKSLGLACTIISRIANH